MARTRKTRWIPHQMDCRRLAVAVGTTLIILKAMIFAMLEHFGHNMCANALTVMTLFSGVRTALASGLLKQVIIICSTAVFWYCSRILLSLYLIAA